MKNLTVEDIKDIILREEEFNWKLYKKVLAENGGHDGSVLCMIYKERHTALLNLMDELEIKRD